LQFSLSPIFRLSRIEPPSGTGPGAANEGIVYQTRRARARGKIKKNEKSRKRQLMRQTASTVLSTVERCQTQLICLSASADGLL